MKEAISNSASQHFEIVLATQIKKNDVEILQGKLVIIKSGEIYSPICLLTLARTLQHGHFNPVVTVVLAGSAQSGLFYHANVTFEPLVVQICSFHIWK